MKYEKYFDDFICKELEKLDYYYKVEYVSKTINNNKYHYEVFINNLKEIYEDRDMVLLERFCDYLDRYNIEYDIDRDLLDIYDYVNVYDTCEYSGN